MNQKVFCLPFNGDVGFALDIAETYPSKIHEFYGNDGMFASGRQHQHLPVKDLRPLIEGLSAQDVSFNYVLNAIDVGHYLRHEDAFFSHLSELSEIGVETITNAHPLFVEQLKDLGFSVSTSAVQMITQVPELRWAKKIGYDRVILAEDVVRNVRQVKNLLNESDGLPIEILVNNVCLLHCPMRMTHYGIDGLSSTDIDKGVLNKYSSLVLECRKMWSDSPASFFKATWIRPDDIHKYLEMGVSFIKLSGRDWSSERLQKAYEIYFAGKWDGFVFDYLRPLVNPQERYGLQNIKNRDLDSFFEFFFDDRLGCDGLCKPCRHCNAFAKRILSGNND